MVVTPAWCVDNVSRELHCINDILL